MSSGKDVEKGRPMLAPMGDSSSSTDQDLEKGPPMLAPKGDSSSSSTNGDVGKEQPMLAPGVDVSSSTDEDLAHESTWTRHLRRAGRTLVKYNLEERGIERVLPENRHDLRDMGFFQILATWVSINITANNALLGLLGPVVYRLPFLDCALLAVFGVMLGALPVGYISTLSPRSGNRTMILVRYAMGWWPAKIVVLLTLVNFLGFCLVDVVLAGQILSAVSSGQSLSIVVGIVITALITWGVTVFGYSIFHYFERYAWFPQFAALMVLAGAAGPKFDLHANPSAGLDSLTVTGNRLSFFSLCFASAITYATCGADYFVYYPENTPRRKVFAVTWVGLTISFTPTLILGAGLTTGLATNPSWAQAYKISQGALIVEALRPVGGFGLFCGVIFAMGLISNAVAPSYSAGVDLQVLGRYFEKIPRVIWNTLFVVVYLILGVVGRAHLATIFTNFLALMGYFVSIFIAIMLEEHLIFKKWKGLGWDWDAWNSREKLPVGIAALIAFLVGWAGAILCMSQVWYIGPIAARLGEDGGDLGSYVGFAWAALVYPPMRWFELRKFGR